MVEDHFKAGNEGPTQTAAGKFIASTKEIKEGAMRQRYLLRPGRPTQKPQAAEGLS